MSDESGFDDKTEQATPRRLEKAREEGQIARSRELTTFLMLLAGTLVIWFSGSWIAQKLAEAIRLGMSFSRERALDPKVAGEYFLMIGTTGLMALAPVLACLAAVAILAPAALGGWLFTPKNLMPKFSRLNPGAGIKRMFSANALTELVKAFAKAGLVGLVATLYVRSNLEHLSGISQLPLEEAIAQGLAMVGKACLCIVASLIVVVMIDVPYQLISFGNKMKMTKQEVKDEFKEQEGDPRLKGKRRAIQAQMSRSRMMSAVPKANIVITNPTHFSVALLYEDNGVGAPTVVAKGVDEVAMKIRELAREHDVPIMESPELARALYWNVEIDDEIPATLYSAVAELLAYIYKLKLFMRGEVEFPVMPTNLPVPAGMDQKPNRKRPNRR
ncbi:flagellar biosynthetic protein FlhB [Pseudomonas nitritireducens]|uniref:Flagellar biosynthetic protein FlhB n=1 Tax=Pseudomonas nitroreducens TaxID=46680 RepID=A0A7W7KMA1_PSENT|nr:flagellar biosynthesis protein FlhB [Pseudomonas nitritireducens]MBB4865409.1 flagellar biosynthetic protein FlhB [Pseudomonas nitritireducens]